MIEEHEPLGTREEHGDLAHEEHGHVRNTGHTGNSEHEGSEHGHLPSSLPAWLAHSVREIGDEPAPVMVCMDCDADKAETRRLRNTGNRVSHGFCPEHEQARLTKARRQPA